ncbi:hypothetical protein BC941DRAFT_474343 [Chlamydoabsidia padenii]|nr:hypothetical protein BC941DRAFT_474343 [Chlamydoabsidia padenii]
MSMDEGLIKKTWKLKKSTLVSKRFPDTCITKLNGVDWDYNVGFGEVKCAGEGDNLHGICKDLLRLGIFSKNAIDIGNIEGVLSFQAVARITAPGCVDDLLGYFMNFNKVMYVLDVFETWCQPVPSEETELHEQRSRASLSSPIYSYVVSPTTSRNRHSVFKHYYN